MRRIRLAIVQVTIHPALNINHVALLSEPFLRGPNQPTLSGLAARGLAVIDLQNLCRDEYTAWEQHRMAGILEHLARLSPVPDLVLFPEGAVPDTLLPLFSEWSKRHSNTIIAGSHTPNLAAKGRHRYQSIGETSRHITEISKYETDNCLALLRRGTLSLIAKSALSVTEKSDLGRAPGAVPKPQSIPVETNIGKIQLLPLNCAEAFRQEEVRDNTDLIAIIGCHRKPKDFHDWATAQVARKQMVVVCNAGQHGGSRFHVAQDSRANNWFSDVFPSGLPNGDFLVVADVDLDVRSVEVGVVDPAQAFSLVQISEIVGQQSPAAKAAVALSRAADLHNDPDKLLTALASLRSDALSEVTKRRVDLLAAGARNGSCKESVSRQVGYDCLVPGVSDLDQLEANLARRCAAPLNRIMADDSIGMPEDQLRQLVAFYAACQQRATQAVDGNGEPPLEKSEERDLLDRSDEIKKIDEFLRGGGPHVLTITGAPSVGKSSIWKKALRSLGIQKWRVITLNESPSPEFLAASAAGLGIEQAQITFPEDWCRRELARYLRGYSVIAIQNAHNLLEYGRWKDPDLRGVLHEVVEAAAAIGVKVIIESRRRTPADENPFLESAQRLKVVGLDGRNATYGVQLLDAQLRRVDLSPESLSQQQKETIVSRLSGHPKALELAANVCLEEGPDELVRGIESGSSDVFTRISRLAKLVALDRQESQVLGLLCRARESVPRSVVTAAASATSAATIRDLIDTGFVEQDTRGWIRIPEVFRPVFQNLRPSQIAVERFHASAASQLARYVGENPQDIATAVEANYHAGIIGKDPVVPLPIDDAAIGIAVGLFRLQQWDEAYRVITVVLRNTRAKQALRMGALIAARLRRLDEALVLARECFDQDNRDFRLLAELGRIALTQHHDALAEELANIASAAGVEDAEVYILRGRLALRRRDLRTAVVLFEKATKLTRQNPWAFLHLGKAYLRLGQIENALEALQDGEKFFYDVSSRNANAIQAIKANIGLCFLQQGKIELATTYIQGIEVDERSPETAVAVAALAARVGGGGHESALASLRQAKFRDQFSRSQSHLMAGQVLLNMGDPQRANIEFEKALEVDNGNVYAMILWARNSYDIALDYRASGDGAYQGYARDSLRLAQKAHEWDRENREVVELLRDLNENFVEIVGNADG